MNKQDLDLVNKTLSNIGDEVLRAVEILQDEKLSNKKARHEACEILDYLLITIPVFMEINK